MTGFTDWITGFGDWMELLKSASSQALGGIPPESDAMRSHNQQLSWLVTPSYRVAFKESRLVG
ncbi:MAG: hypothetical protein F6K50_19880 [Moorea sp. SIO3I7]|uniref:hypothetical protein n=1 Tax=Moorena sp. SIO3I8 TaxID=2607833 RepID=UPI0013C0D6CB|nr:hypothetical protein [Moorena sp. SIO3I8]NEN97703.1 hypothetical protein [Moorena sp. SIO3I7]NEO04985.1 hypothetical protein [Moorena sp. SIO3I8]